MRGRGTARLVVAAQAMLLVAALVGPAAVAAATVGFTLGAPSVSTVQYSDLVTLRGTYTCTNDVASDCPTTSSSQTATFAVRPSGGSTFTTVATLLSSVVFTSNPAGCPTTCSVAFQATWRAGRAGAVTIPPGVYDVGLSTTASAGMLVSLAALTITPEDSQTTYTGSTSGFGGDPLSLAATVADLDRGQSPGTSIITPDVNLGGPTMVTFALYDASNTTLVAGPVAAQLASNGNTAGLPTLITPTAGGTFKMRTTYVGNGFYTTSSDLDTITISASNTPPVLVVPTAPVVAEATSPAGAAVGYVVSATDAEDDPDPTPTCAPASGATFALGDTTVSCSVTDSAGATTTDSFTVRVVDSTKPLVSVSSAESRAASGWYNVVSNDGSPGVTLDVATDDLVGVASLACTDNGADVGALPVTGGSFVVGDGVHSIACVAMDGSANEGSASRSISVDQTAPSVSGSLSPAVSGTGWWNAASGAPTVTWSCSDATSGVAACSPPSTFGDGAIQGATGTAVDAAGNVGTGSVAGVNVDRTAPTAIALTGTSLADGATYDFGSVPPAPTGCTASDAVSGLASCTVVGYSASIGSWTVTATATDVAGNTATMSLSYVVAPWVLTGFDKPIDMAAVNDLKAGNSALLKFSVDAGATDPSLVVFGLEQQLVACPAALKGPSGHGAPHETTSRKGGVAFSARWQAPNLPGTCWLVTLRTADGSALSALFRLR